MRILRRLYSSDLLLVAMLVLMVVAVMFTFLPRSPFGQQRSPQQATAEAMRQRGGTVVMGPSRKDGLPPDVISVILNKVDVDAESIQMIGQFAGIEQLTLNSAKLQLERQGWAPLSKLSKLQSLSVSHSNLTDSDALQFPLGLTRLSLNGTVVTDTCIPRLNAMSGLAALNIADTNVTAEGVRLLVSSPSLQKLRVGDSCITAESVESLRLMQLQSIEVVVSEGLGQSAHELLSLLKGPEIIGHHRDGYVLWAANKAWPHTLAGVVDAVVSETRLDPQQAAQLLEVLANQEPPGGNWGPTVLEPPPSPGAVSWVNFTQDQGVELASVEAFVDELQKRPLRSKKTGVYSAWDYWAVRRFAREKFSAKDVPHLLATIRTGQFSSEDHLLDFGPFLLVHHGIDNPEVRGELDRLLEHEDISVRVHTICAFAYGGARKLYSRDEWAANKAADDFAVPRLVRICEDGHEDLWTRDTASQVLSEIAQRRPEYAAVVIPVLIDLLDEGGLQIGLKREGNQSRVDIPRLAEVDTHAALAVVPKLRAILKQLDAQLAGVPVVSPENSNSPQGLLHRRRHSVLDAMSAIAYHDPELAHEIALEYLNRMADGRPAGPLATLLSRDTPEANRIVVSTLLRDANAAEGELASVAKRIRDQRMDTEPVDEESR